MLERISSCILPTNNTSYHKQSALVSKRSQHTHGPIKLGYQQNFTVTYSSKFTVNVLKELFAIANINTPKQYFQNVVYKYSVAVN